ncbi:MAG TPA: formate dehydrogenase accessory sulfurtransferase FdhD [Solirubrobacteraceae bacterium]|jgi:FdhD protein|nr:formate dehydrogenase accessory sulfurtransferase FdhD [Solirubrobacteraceae bacterium]
MDVQRTERVARAASEVFLARATKPVTRDGRADVVAVEEPLQIVADAEPIAITMRTPGDDEELAVGFLHGEGLLRGVPSVAASAELESNTAEVSGALARRPASRRFYTTSSCGVCGKGALEEVSVHAPRIEDTVTFSRELLARLPQLLEQPGFRRTGGLHATGLYSRAGELLCVREDVGRHNAMDKVVGWAVLSAHMPLSGCALCVSSRICFELVQKAAVAQAPVLVGVGAPTSLAIELAHDRGMTLCGFARGDSVNVYAGAQRVDGAPRAT